MKNRLVVACMFAFLFAGATEFSPSSRAFQILRHNVNQVEMCVSNYGKFGQDETGNYPGCWWPAGTNHSYIYGAGLWFGTIDTLTGDTLVTIGFMPSGGAFEFTPGLSGWSPTNPVAIIYMYPENWPPPPDTFPMAPQDTISHQDSWCCFNDSNPTYHVIGDTRPIGIEVYQSVYAWDIPCVEDIIFMTYDVKNVSGVTLRNCYIGMVADGDIGYETGPSGNDRCSGIVHRGYIVYPDSFVVDNVAYQWQEVEEPGTPPWFPGTIGFDLLQTPFDLVEGMDKDGDGILDQYERDSTYYVNNLPPSMWDVDYDGVPDWRDPSQWPQMGMAALKRFTPSFEPTTDPKRYMSLAGYNHLTGQYEPYDTVIPDPDEQRFLLSSGPFDLAPDSVVTLIFAVMFADWIAYARPDTAIALIDRWAEHYYDMYWYLYTGVEENQELRNANCGFAVSPNPVMANGRVRFSLTHDDHVILKLYNSLGQLVETVYDGLKHAGVHEFVLSTQNQRQGTYFLVLETGDFNASRSVVILR